MVCFALGWNPQKSYIFLLIIQVARSGLFRIRLKSPEQLHFVASFSSCVLWFVLHQVEIPQKVTFCCFSFKWHVVVCLALGCIPRTVTFCCFLFKWSVVVCFALGWNPENSYILLLLIQVACCGLSCIRVKSPEPLHFVASYSSGVLCFFFALGWNPQNSYILLLLIQVACCGLFCIRLKSPEQLHFLASYSSGVFWFVSH